MESFSTLQFYSLALPRNLYLRINILSVFVGLKTTRKLYPDRAFWLFPSLSCFLLVVELLNLHHVHVHIWGNPFYFPNRKQSDNLQKLALIKDKMGF